MLIVSSRFRVTHPDLLLLNHWSTVNVPPSEPLSSIRAIGIWGFELRKNIIMSLTSGLLPGLFLQVLVVNLRYVTELMFRAPGLLL